MSRRVGSGILPQPEDVLRRLSPARYAFMFSGIYLAMFLIRLAFGIVVVTFGKYVEGDNFVFGLLVASSPLLELVTVLYMGELTDRFGKKALLLAGLALGSAGLFALALTKNLLLLGVINALHGVSAAFILVTTLAIIASYAPPDKRGREMGLFNFSNMFGWICGFAAGSLLLGAGMDPRMTFVVAGALGTLGLVYSYFAVREPAKGAEVDHDHSPLGALQVLRRKAILLIAVPWFLVFLFVNSSVTFFSRAIPGGDSAGAAFPGTSVALGLLALGVLFVASQLVFGRLSDAYGREPFMLVGALGFIALLVVIASGYFGQDAANQDPRLAFDHLRDHAVLFAFFTFCALGFAPAGLAALADEAPARSEGVTMSIYTLMAALGTIVGPPAVGAVADFAGGRGVLVFYFTLSFLILGFTSLRIVVKRREVRDRFVRPMMNDLSDLRRPLKRK